MQTLSQQCIGTKARYPRPQKMTELFAIQLMHLLSSYTLLYMCPTLAGIHCPYCFCFCHTSPDICQGYLEKQTHVVAQALHVGEVCSFKPAGSKQLQAQHECNVSNWQLHVNVILARFQYQYKQRMLDATIYGQAQERLQNHTSSMLCKHIQADFLKGGVL